MSAIAATGEPGGRTDADEFDYPLPADRIAQTPAPCRDAARLLVLDRSDGSVVHSGVSELPSWLRPGDLLVFNDARVIPARLRGQSEAGGAVEVLLVAESGGGFWSCLGKPAKRLRLGSRLVFSGKAAATVAAVRGQGRYTLQFGGGVDVRGLLAAAGEMPLPPYIKRPDGPLPLDGERYQTVFAREDGAVAAPTAGLHFTHDLLRALARASVETAALTLDVGPATFLPLRSGDLASHAVEPERAFIPAATAEAVVRARRERRRVVAVGTTTTRALESAARSADGIVPGELWADAFISPGFDFRVVDALLTNFHLPKSTLLMLVGAFAGRERILGTYSLAVREGYRFYSYGDAMLIV